MTVTIILINGRSMTYHNTTLLNAISKVEQLFHTNNIVSITQTKEVE
jgi:hypothetical protein